MYIFLQTATYCINNVINIKLGKCVLVCFLFLEKKTLMQKKNV